MILSGWRGCKAVSLPPSGQLSSLRDKPCWGLDGFLLPAGWVVEVEEGLAGVCDSIREPQSWFQGGRRGKLAPYCSLFSLTAYSVVADLW